MGMRRGALSPVVATTILVAMAIVIGIVVAFWARSIMEGLTYREETCMVSGVIKKVDSRYVLISTSDDKRYILMGPEEVLRPLSEMPLKVRVQGRLIRQNMTIQVKRVEIDIPLLGRD